MPIVHNTSTVHNTLFFRGNAKKATMELDAICKDRGIRKELKMKLVKALIWPVITYERNAARRNVA